MCADGSQQKLGIDYETGYAPVARAETFRMLLAGAAFNLYIVHKIDIITAFLNGELEEIVYMYPPDCIGEDTDSGSGKDRVAWQLLRSLYGLKQASRAWYDKLHTALTKMGFTRSEYDNCLYIKKDVQLAFHVDDFMIVAPDLTKMDAFKSELSQHFKLKDLGAIEDTEFLGMQVEHDVKTGSYKLHQEHYARECLKRFGMGECASVHTPLPENLRMKPAADEPDVPLLSPIEHGRFREQAGCLIYLMSMTRPDLANAVRQVTQHQAAPNVNHQMHLKHIWRYVRGTENHGLTWSRAPRATQLLQDIKGYEPTVLQGFSDSSHAPSIHDECKSITGYMYMLHGAAVTWHSRMQKGVSLSATEGEYVAASDAAQEATWLRYILDTIEPSAVQGPTTIFEDNQGAIFIGNNPVNASERLKHVHKRYHYVRSCITDGTVKLVYVPTALQLADTLTKNLGRTQFTNLRNSYMG